MAAAPVIIMQHSEGISLISISTKLSANTDTLENNSNKITSDFLNPIRTLFIVQFSHIILSFRFVMVSRTVQMARMRPGPCAQ